MAEGSNVIRVLLASEYRVRSILLTPRKLDVLAPELEGVDVPIYIAGQQVMNRTVGFNIHRGAVAVAERPPPQSLDDTVRGARRVGVVEAMTDQENLGQLFRNAAGLGVDALLLCPRTCDPFYRRTVRVSMGQVLRVPHARLANWPDALDVLRGAGFTITALTPAASAADLTGVDPHRFERVALMVGSEGPGLTVDALARADLQLRIPMAGDVDSLNVATAAAIAFHHFRVRT